jgi:hypothetical protein
VSAMRSVAIDGVQFVIAAAPIGDRWTARAERSPRGTRFGPACTGSTEAEAIDRMAVWLAWQADHVRALEALQQAERDWHRAIAGTFAEGAGDRPDPALSLIEAARVRLDEIRARRPE